MVLCLFNKSIRYLPISVYAMEKNGNASVKRRKIFRKYFASVKRRKIFKVKNALNSLLVLIILVGRLTLKSKTSTMEFTVMMSSSIMSILWILMMTPSTPSTLKTFGWALSVNCVDSLGHPRRCSRRTFMNLYGVNDIRTVQRFLLLFVV